MATIKGVWVFNETLDFSVGGMYKYGITEPSAYFGATFISDGVQMAGFIFDCSQLSHGLGLWAYDTKGWTKEEYRTVDFGDTEQTVDDVFYAWFTANANEQFFYEPGYFIKAETLVGIGDAIRRKLDTKDRFPPEEMEQAIDSIVNNHYDTFWDAFQDKGNRTQYANAFRGSGWTDATFKPKYDMHCDVWDNYVFQGCSITDLKGILEAAGVTLDTSNVSGGTQWFCYTKLTRIPPLDCRSMTTFLSMFQSSTDLQEIELNNVREDLTGNNAFASCTALTTVKITGTIGTSSFNFNWSPLTTESMKNIILCLKNYAGTANAYAYTVQFSSTCWAALDAEGETAPGDITWRKYVENIGWNA